MISDCVVIEFFTARKNIHGHIRVLGPGMNRYVRFGDNNDATDTVGAEIMENRFHDRSTTGEYRLTKQLFQKSCVLYS